jgi:hypothetical protein
MNIFLGTFFHFIKFLKFKKSSSCLGRNLDFQAQPLKVIPLGRSLKFNKTLKGIPSIICKALGEKFVVDEEGTLYPSISKKDLLVHRDNRHLVLINAEDPNQCTSLILTLIIWLDLIVKCQIELILKQDNF